MGLAAILFISFVALFSIIPQMSAHRSLPEQEVATRELFIKKARLLNRDYAYVPPARKSVMLDAEGVAQRTADGMQMTKRDRSRKIDVSKSADIRFEAAAPAAVVPPPVTPAPEPPGVYVTSAESVPEAPHVVVDEHPAAEPLQAPPATGPMMPPASPLAPESPAAVESTVTPAEEAAPVLPVFNPEAQDNAAQS